MAVLSEAYREDEVNGEERVYLALPYDLAPVKLAVFPLLKNKPELTTKAREIYKHLNKQYGAVMWDDNGNIIVILFLLGALPTWPYSAGWGYYPAGGLGAILIILLILALVGVL